MHMAVTKRREEGGGRPPSRAAKLASLGVRPGDLSLLPVTQQGSDQDLAREKQRRAQRKRKGKAKQLMMKHKQRVHKCIAYTAIFTSACMLGLILASIILIVQVEYCR